MEQHFFGRKKQFDTRSRAYPVRELLTTTEPRSYTWRVPVLLDQALTPACVGFAWSAEAAARPVEVRGITDQDGLSVYARAQELDVWPGNDYEGTSVIAGA